jgi:hypothetical protein
VFAALASAREPIDAKTIAASFRSGGRASKKIEAVLASLARLGHVATRDGRVFEIRRAA